MFFDRAKFGRCCIGLSAVSIILILSTKDRAAAANPSTAPATADALTILEAHCVRCHGGENTKGGLDLRTREAALRGGDEGAAIVPGKAKESLLVQTMRHEVDPHMPHKAKKLPDEAPKPGKFKLAESAAAGEPAQTEAAAPEAKEGA